MVVRSYDEELKYLERITPTSWRIKKGFVPNMNVRLVKIIPSIHRKHLNLILGWRSFLCEQPSRIVDVWRAEEFLPAWLSWWFCPWNETNCQCCLFTWNCRQINRLAWCPFRIWFCYWQHGCFWYGWSKSCSFSWRCWIRHKLRCSLVEDKSPRKRYPACQSKFWKLLANNLIKTHQQFYI